MKITWIEPDLLAVSYIPADAEMVKSLHEQGIRAIVSLTENPLTAQKTITRRLLADLDITYFHAPIDDWHPPDLPTADSVVEFIDRMKAEGRPTLMHCHAGIGRTGTMLHFYYLAKGLSLEEAKQIVVSRRPICAFNGLLSPSQRAFLRDYAGDVTS